MTCVRPLRPGRPPSYSLTSSPSRWAPWLLLLLLAAFIPLSLEDFSYPAISNVSAITYAGSAAVYHKVRGQGTGPRFRALSLGPLFSITRRD